MTIIVAVYLKSGKKVSLEVSNTTLEKQQAIYADIFLKESGSSFITHIAPASIEMIPIENVDFIQFKKK